MPNPSNRSTGFTNSQSDAPGGRAKRIASSAGAPDLGRPSGEDFREVTVFGVTHYIQAVLYIAVAVLLAWLASYSWYMYNLPNHGYAADDDSFGSGLGAAMDYWTAMVFPRISWFLFLFAGFSFLVGNRLIRRQWRRFCRVAAIFESVLGVALVAAGLLVWFLAYHGVIDGNVGGEIAITCFLSFPLTVIPCVIGIYTLRMLKRQRATFP
jgi:hypothetical protein